MPLTFSDLGEARGLGFNTPSNVTGSLVQGYQIGQLQQAKKEAARLKRQEAIDRQDEAWAKAYDSQDYKGIHESLIPKLKRENASTLKEADQLRKTDYLGGRRKLNEVVARLDTAREQSRYLNDLEKADENELSEGAKLIKKAWRETKDIDAVKDMVDPVSGENLWNITRNKFIDVGKLRNDVLGNTIQKQIAQRQINGDTRIQTFGITDQDAQAVAEDLWNNPEVQSSYFNQNYKPVMERFGKKVERMSSLTERGLLKDDPTVEQFLKNQFFKETMADSKRIGKELMDAIPQPSRPGSSTKNTVSFERRDVPANDPLAVAIFGPNRPATVLEESTPAEGENKPVSYSANSGFIIKNGQKSPVNLNGKQIKGAIVRTISSPSSDGKKEVYAVIEGSGLTNKQLDPETYKHLEEIEFSGSPLTIQQKETLRKADDVPQTTYVVPYREVAKNQKAEYAKYNKADAIKSIEKGHGIKYSDFTPDSGSGGKKVIKGF